jgi:hypothetical protein
VALFLVEVLMFDPEEFVVDCQRAATTIDAVAAVQELVAAAVRNGRSIDAVLGTELGGEADTSGRALFRGGRDAWMYSATTNAINRTLRIGGGTAPSTQLGTGPRRSPQFGRRR